MLLDIVVPEMENEGIQGSDFIMMCAFTIVFAVRANSRACESFAFPSEKGRAGELVLFGSGKLLLALESTLRNPLATEFQPTPSTPSRLKSFKRPCRNQ